MQVEQEISQSVFILNSQVVQHCTFAKGNPVYKILFTESWSKFLVFVKVVCKFQKREKFFSLAVNGTSQAVKSV